MDRRAYDVFATDDPERVDTVAWKSNTERAEPLLTPEPLESLRPPFNTNDPRLFMRRASTGQRYLGTVLATPEELATLRPYRRLSDVTNHFDFNTKVTIY